MFRTEKYKTRNEVYTKLFHQGFLKIRTSNGKHYGLCASAPIYEVIILALIISLECYKCDDNKDVEKTSYS